MRRRQVYTLEQIIDLFQLEVPLLRPRDLKKKRTSWCAYLGWDAVKKRPVELYAPGHLTRAEAFEKMQPRILAYLQGRLPMMVSFDGYVKKWLSTVTCMPSTKANYVSSLEKHLLPVFGGKKLKDISSSDIRQYLMSKQVEEGKDQKRLAAKSINDHLVLLRSIFKAAFDDELIQRNPASVVKKLPQMKSRVEAFSEEDVRKILDTARKLYPRYYAPILHAFSTGQRAGEIWAQKWSDIGKGKIKIERAVRNGRVGPTKDHEQRFADLPDKLTTALNESSAYHSKLRGEWLYTNEAGSPVDHNNFCKRTWYPLLKAAEVRPLNFHCCRHTFASLHLRHGTSLEWISKQLGHYSLEFTFKTYVHFQPKADEGAADRLMAIIMG